MSEVAALLLDLWGLEGADVEPLGGGMNSETWLVRHDGSTYVAKRVPRPLVADLVTGCEISSGLATSGVTTGAPVPTTDGRLVVEDQGMVLLRHVPGRELTGDTDLEQEWMAGMLATVHRAGGPTAASGVSPFMDEWLSADVPGVSSQPWLVSAIAEVLAATATLTLTWSTVHADPAPEAFVHDDDTGVTGLIDWSGARRGPVLYDVASAVMYLGGRREAAAFLDAYTQEGVLSSAELAHLNAFGRFRECIQGAYFAKRLAEGDLTGGVDPSENMKGIEDARRRLALLTSFDGT